MVLIPLLMMSISGTADPSMPVSTGIIVRGIYVTITNCHIRIVLGGNFDQVVIQDLNLNGNATGLVAFGSVGVPQTVSVVKDLGQFQYQEVQHRGLLMLDSQT